MVNVSKKPLKERIQRHINDQLIELFAASHTKRIAAQLMRELLSDTEQLMLAKRLAVLVMVERNCSSYEIQKTLHVSTATIARIRDGFLKGHYPTFEKLLRRKQSREELYAKIDILLQVGLPPIAGRGRWSRTYKVIDAWRKSHNSK